MIFWILMTALCSAVAVAISVPLIRRYEQAPAIVQDQAVYHDQMKELAKDRDAGVIGESEAEAAKIEIQRRLLASTRAAQAARPLSPRWKTLALVSSCAVVVLGATNLYAWLGSPDLGTTINVSEPAPAPVAQTADATGTPPQPAMPAVAGTQPQPINDVISVLAARLKTNPNDAEGWRMLGWSYFNTQQYQASAEAYGKALELDPANIDYKSSHAEALVQAAEGIVTPRARQLIAEVLAKDAKEPRARFYDALANEQAGDQAGSLDRWLALLADAPADAPWRQDVSQHVTALGKALGRDVRQATASTGVAPSDNQQMGQAERNAMVDGMIAKLQAKLDKTPNDRDGWAMLIRSLNVKGDKAAADQALARALEIFKDDPATLAGLKSISSGAVAQAPAASSQQVATPSLAPVISADQQAAVQAMSPQDQQEMIKSMVARLASKLEQNPNDGDGWVRLMRSYMVLQDTPKARETLAKALTIFAADLATQDKLKAAASELGVN
jgi:cytochrome c-type biogenesis protein CcmH